MKPPLPAAPTETMFQEAADWIRSAEALLIAAGAGMGVDSGLPDFRGTEGFWNAYPPFRHLGLSFVDLANPAWFHNDPPLAWGFYGHRLNLYRRTPPHAGFQILRRWAAAKPAGVFVFTSNVDGHFQRAGFDENRVVEYHGSIHRLQRVDESAGRIWDVGDTQVIVDEAKMRAVGELPRDPLSGELARPNILMFDDFEWNGEMTKAQHERYREWLEGLAGERLVVIELGAGTAVPSVRRHSEHLIARGHIRLIRINVREAEVPDGQLGLACGALAALTAIDQMLGFKL
jgi:NAD-dependent SIR2 family protein deacetylase